MKWLDDIRFKMDVNTVGTWLQAARDVTEPFKKTISKKAAKIIKVEFNGKNYFFTIHQRTQNKTVTSGPDGRYHWAYDKYEISFDENGAPQIRPVWSGYYPYSTAG